MPEQRTTPNRRIAHAVWWAAVAAIVFLVAVLVWGGLYAGRRVWALQAFDTEGTAGFEMRTPPYVPEWLRPRLPAWAHEIREVHGLSRSHWQALAAFPEVQTVAFLQSGLIDTDLQSLRCMRQLTSLTLESEPEITDIGIAHLEGLPRLRELTILGSELGDISLQSIARIPRLEQLSLEETEVTGLGLAALQEARHLRTLVIEIRAGSATSLEALEHVESLEELNLSGEGITAEAIQHLRLPPRLRSLSLSGPELNDAQVDDLPELLAAVPGIEHVETLDLGGMISSVTLAQIGERLGMVKYSGTFRRKSR